MARIIIKGARAFPTLTEEQKDALQIRAAQELGIASTNFTLGRIAIEVDVEEGYDNITPRIVRFEFDQHNILFNVVEVE